MRLFGHFLPAPRVRLFLAEQAAAGVLFLAALASAGRFGASSVGAAFGTVLGVQGALYLADLYAPQREPGPRGLIAVGLGIILAALGWLVWGASRPGFLLLALALATTVMVLLRGLSLVRLRRVLVFGIGPAAWRVARAVREQPELFRLHGFIDDGSAPGRPVPIPLVLGRPERLDELAREAGTDLVVLAAHEEMPEEALVRARAAGVEVLSAAAFLERHTRRIAPDLLAPGELALGEGFHASRLGSALQRALDVAAAVVLLVLSLPLLLGGMLAVRLDSPGPIFYRQERVGRGGRTFFVTKLRTMRADAEAGGVPQWAAQNDARVTRVGRLLRLTRIDELPQLFAVLAGHMSLVGPRPERPFFVEQLKQQIPLYALRELVRPGVTGWAQISYPYGATVEDARNKLEFDLYYVKHRSLFLDAAILFHTARTVLTARGAR